MKLLLCKSILDCFGKSRKKRLKPAGKIIAFMGGDGSGKTSNIREFEKWFGQYFNVRVLHVGKPSKGPLWYGIGVLLKLRKILLRIRTDNFHESVKYLMVAWYRRRTFQKAVALRSKGFLVALDRFPLPGMEIMEAPQIERLTGGGGIYDFMAKLECKFHQGIRGADEIFVLMLDPVIAQTRRPEDRPQELKRRCSEILHRDWPDGYAHLIDASQPFDEVVLKIRRLAWNALNKTVRVVEIIGPAGVGKTTVAKQIKEMSNSVQTSVSWHDSKRCLMKVMVKRSAKILRLLFQRVPAEVIKEVVGLEVDLEILLTHKSRHVLPCREVLLEVGPVFKVSKLKMDGNIQSIKWIDEIYGKIDRALDGLIWMDSSNEILKTRINLREKKHEIKNAASDEIYRFLNDYRKCFSEMLDNCNGNFAVNRLDISSMSVKEVAGSISQMAFKTEKIV